MYQQVTFQDFCDAFRTMDRDDNFSYFGKRALFDYLEAYENDTGEPVKLDIIALCCDYNEATYEEIASAYDIECDDEDGLEDAVREHLEHHTSVVGEVPGGFVYAEF